MQDNILQHLMYEFDAEQSQPARLDAVSATGSASTAFSSDSPEMPVNRVPGGTISFIFERFSATIEKVNDGEPGDGGSS